MTTGFMGAHGDPKLVLSFLAGGAGGRMGGQGLQKCGGGGGGGVRCSVRGRTQACGSIRGRWRPVGWGAKGGVHRCGG